jgi:hypothetical protein
MTTIISNDEFRIIRDKRTQHLYTLEFQTYSEIIIKSLIKTKIVHGATVSSDYRTLKLKAVTIQTFKQFQEEQHKINGSKNLRVHLAAKMLENLATQLKYIITIYRQSFMGYSPDNVIVIDGNKFAYICQQHLSYIQEGNEQKKVPKQILMSFPFSPMDFFVSPEQLIITELPAYIHYKTSYYSLGCLVIYSLSNNDDFLKDENDKTIHERFTEQLDLLSIVESKLYWLLKNCLLEDPLERKILFI